MKQIILDEKIIDNSAQLLTNEDKDAIMLPQPNSLAEPHDSASETPRQDSETYDKSSAPMQDSIEDTGTAAEPHTLSNVLPNAFNDEQNEQSEIMQENKSDEENPLTPSAPAADNAEQKTEKANEQSGGQPEI